jgi:methylmalonyl-CoA mutase cobalamin-binding subunit
MAHSLGSQALCRTPNPAMPAADMVCRSATPLRSADPDEGARRSAAASLHADTGILDLFERTLLSPDPDIAREAVQALCSTGLSQVQIADLYVPAMARRLGERWHHDELSFAQVTIGMSRLQRLVRDLVAEVDTGRSAGREVGSLLLVVPEAEQHTLGAILLCGQLRRRGLSVRLCLGFRSCDAADALSSGSYDGVLISASRAYSLENLQDVIKSVRDAAPSALPVCIGGSFSEPLRLSREVEAAVHLTEDIDEALKICGIQSIVPPPARSALRS